MEVARPRYIVVTWRHFYSRPPLVVCDMPARSLTKNVKAHNGYFGHDKCTRRGCWRGRMIYPKIDAPLRTDASFRDMEQPEHHNGASPFMELEGLGMVSQFPVDPMHCVYLGVVRKLLRYWTQKGPRCVRLPSAKVAELSENLNAVKSSMPRDFSRHPRVMRKREHWEATECRYFLLYAAPVVLKSVLPRHIYVHYMCLHVAIRILTCVSSSAQMITYAESLLECFVRETGCLYGEEAVVYNVHALAHLVNDVRRLGALESFSMLPLGEPPRHAKTHAEVRSLTSCTALEGALRESM
ncbi:hypothetical protein HPB47_018959 [Ixodes persulcatus]|uniref:Uncharacterized protein n=1 Tax=Ixodes persulcatus TaxID=34615 RepID=A0AC60QN02_IXOPE|nr:hypothetical protein HPB47_018959 [Ixodes persulcatus]